MAYTALYRKWRPTRFEDVRGQEHIVRTLKNQLNSDRIGHAYLFCGTRGTGKTTIAKIFARAVNCEHPVDGSPCNECPTCRSILSGNSVNVVEIDAASNNGVDNIREIREEVRYKPTEGKYRVYIIDEVHMLSTGAFNALLKTLEEPPEYVIFILATTEVQKIPITVLSRCQRYDFKRLTMEELENQVRDLLQAENVPAEESAIHYIARKADGSSRDALSLLEECISFHYGETLTYERVLEVLGAVDQTVFSNLLRAVLSYNIASALSQIEDLLSAGRDLSQFVTDFTWYLRNILLIQTENPGEEVLGISRENLLLMQEEAGKLDINRVMRLIRILSQLTNQMRASSSKRVLLEVAVLKMMQPDTELDLESLTDRVRALEEGGVVYAAPQSAGNSQGTARPASGSPSGENTGKAPQAPREIEVSPAVYEDYQKISADWQDIVLSQSSLIRSLLVDTKVSASERGVVIFFKNPFNFSLVEKKIKAKNWDPEQILAEKYQKKVNVAIQCLKENESAPIPVAGARISGIEMDIEEE